MDRITIFTDGCCKGNPGTGGWGVIIKHDGGTEEMFGGEEHTTNNRMELTAALKGLDHPLAKGKAVELVTDSTYVLKGITEWVPGWVRKNWVNSKKEPVANRDLWEQLIVATADRDVKWKWVKGHDSDDGNNHADLLSNKGAYSVMTDEQRAKIKAQEEELEKRGYASREAYFIQKNREARQLA